MVPMDVFLYIIEQKISMLQEQKITNVSQSNRLKKRQYIKSNLYLFFVAVDSELVFEHGEVSKVIAIPIINDLEAEKDESFAVELCEPITGGANLGKHVKTVVTIINDDGRVDCQKKLEN